MGNGETTSNSLYSGSTNLVATGTRLFNVMAMILSGMFTSVDDINVPQTTAG